MEMDGLDEVYRLQRFLPTREEALCHFLPRLLAGETLGGADKLIHHANIYACEPRDLAAKYPPVPTAVSTGDRFFFTHCKRKGDRCSRGAGAGTWTVQTTEDVHDDEGVKLGEARTVSFKKNKKSTGWVMEEYRCLLPQAVVPGGEMVLCRIHLANNPPAAARQESNAYKLSPRRQQGADPAPTPQLAEPVTVMASAHAQKRPAPIVAADLSSCKKMRTAAPAPVPEPEIEYEDCPMWFMPASSAQWPAADPPCSNKMWMSGPAPAPDAEESTPAAAVSTLPATSTEAPEADDNMGQLSCSWEELFRSNTKFLIKAWSSLRRQLTGKQQMYERRSKLSLSLCNIQRSSLRRQSTGNSSFLMKKTSLWHPVWLNFTMPIFTLHGFRDSTTTSPRLQLSLRSDFVEIPNVLSN